MMEEMARCQIKALDNIEPHLSFIRGQYSIFIVVFIFKFQPIGISLMVLIKCLDSCKMEEKEGLLALCNDIFSHDDHEGPGDCN
jgi:hypothetical protein